MSRDRASRVTEMVGRYAFRSAAFLFGFAVLQWFAFTGFWLGPQPIIILSFFTILDALAYPLFTIFSLVAVLAQLRPFRFTWHPWAALLLMIAGLFFITDALLKSFAR
jgi:hypothetical protein